MCCLAAAGVDSASAAARRGPCDRYASPRGSDRHGRGTARRPFHSVGRLDRALRPGQTGCLLPGTYGGIHTTSRLRRSGTRNRRITITSYPVGAATVVGYVALEGSYTTVSHLRIDGSNTLLESPVPGAQCRHHVSMPLSIGGHDDILEYDDYYQSVPSLRATGIGIGFWGHPDNTIIRYSKIHDVGQCQAFDHLIYLSHGNNVQIYGNWLWNDPHGRGVQLYPAPTNARVFNNVIDHAGEGFVIGNEPGDTVSGNQIYNNIITNSTGLPWEHIRGEAIHDLYGGARGRGNTFHSNILYRNPGGIGHLIAVRAYKNVRANPHFADPAQHDYQLLPSSPIAGLNLWNGIISLPVKVGVG
jgi:hypothetical protein